MFSIEAVVGAQLVERSLPTLEIRSLNPDIGKVFYLKLFNRKDEKKKKRLGMAHL